MFRALTKLIFGLAVGENVVFEEGFYRVPWNQRSAPAEYMGSVATATLFVLKDVWRLPQFVSQVRRVLKDLRTAPGLVGYSLQARSVGGPYWTLSVWSDQPNMRVFVEGEAHLHASIALSRHMARFAARTWPIEPESIPPSWARAMEVCPAEPPKHGE